MPLSRRARASAIGSYLRLLRYLLIDVFAHQDFEQAAHLAMLLGLRIDPAADHLLLAAHVMHQPLDRFREIGHGGRGRAARAAVSDGLAQSLDGQPKVTRPCA